MTVRPSDAEEQLMRGPKPPPAETPATEPATESEAAPEPVA